MNNPDELFVVENVHFKLWQPYMEWKIPQLQLYLLHTLNYTLEITVRVVIERNFTTKEMISIFPLLTFNLCVATFQQHLYMVYAIIFQCLWFLRFTW